MPRGGANCEAGAARKALWIGAFRFFKQQWHMDMICRRPSADTVLVCLVSRGSQVAPLQHFHLGACGGVSISICDQFHRNSAKNPVGSPPEAHVVPSCASPPSHWSQIPPSSTVSYKWWKLSRGIYLPFTITQMWATCREEESTRSSYLTQACNWDYGLVWDEGRRCLFCLFSIDICYENRVLESYCIVQ